MDFKTLIKRYFVICISVIAFASLFCSCGPDDEPDNPEENAVYY